MSLLEVSNLSMNYPDKNLFGKSSFTLESSEKLGLMGENGAGKSTLIKILLGEIVPVDGNVKWQKNISIGYLDQYLDIDINLSISSFLAQSFEEQFKKFNYMNKIYEEYALTLDDKLLNKASHIQDELDSANFHSIQNDIEKVLTGLGLGQLSLDTKIKDLSGGQKSKVMMAKLLLAENDVIILDEPTNYLDVDHVTWLIGFLNEYKGAFILISHDKEFFGSVINSAIDIFNNQITKYNGDFKSILNQKEIAIEQNNAEYSKQKDWIKKTEGYISKNKAGVNAKQARGREKLLNRVDRLSEISDTRSSSFSFPFSKVLNNPILKIKDLEFGYDGKPLTQKLNLNIFPGKKIAISGFNGLGKTTLIKTILGQLPAISGDVELNENAEVNYFDQELFWDDENKNPVQIIQGTSTSIDDSEARKILARVNITKEHSSQKITSLSGGEQTKIKLIKMSLNKSNFLILDEPNNHLDAKTKESLKEVLREFKGSVLLVSHEKDFYEDWIDEEISVDKLSTKNK